MTLNSSDIEMDNGWPLIDFSKFPNEAIAGQTLSQINDVMIDDQSFQAYNVDQGIDALFHNIPDIPEDLLWVSDLIRTMSSTRS